MNIIHSVKMLGVFCAVASPVLVIAGNLIGSMALIFAGIAVIVCLALWFGCQLFFGWSYSNSASPADTVIQGGKE